MLIMQQYRERCKNHSFINISMLIYNNTQIIHSIQCAHFCVGGLVQTTSPSPYQNDAGDQRCANVHNCRVI